MPRSYDRKSRRQFQHPLPPPDPPLLPEGPILPGLRTARSPFPLGALQPVPALRSLPKPDQETALPVIRRHRVAKSPFPLSILQPGHAKRRQYPILPIDFLRLHSRVFRGFRQPPFSGKAIRQRVPGAGEESQRIVLRRPRRKRVRDQFPMQLLRGHWQRAQVPAAADVVRIGKRRIKRGQQKYPKGHTHRTRTIPGEVLEPHAVVRQHIIASWLRLLPPPFVGAWPHKVRTRHPPNIFHTGEVGPVPVNPCQGPNVRPDEICDEPTRPPDCAKEK